MFTYGGKLTILTTLSLYVEDTLLASGKMINRELLLYGHGIKVGFFAHHSQADTSTFQEKCTNLE